MALAERAGKDKFTGGQIYAEMLSAGTRHSKSTVLRRCSA
jgi:hypothetical protein